MNKDRYLHTGMMLFFIITAVGVGYFFFTYLPAQDYHKRVIECRVLCEKIEEEINSHDLMNPRMTLDPEYCYNSKFKKCYYYGGYMDNEISAQFIIDAYTNKKIASLIENTKIHLTRAEILLRRSEFNKKKQELFDEGQKK